MASSPRNGDTRPACRHERRVAYGCRPSAKTTAAIVNAMTAGLPGRVWRALAFHQVIVLPRGYPSAASNQWSSGVRLLADSGGAEQIVDTILGRSGGRA